jgi:hypothetical protein
MTVCPLWGPLSLYGPLPPYDSLLPTYCIWPSVHSTALCLLYGQLFLLLGMFFLIVLQNNDVVLLCRETDLVETGHFKKQGKTYTTPLV